jgi:hypothetical protein
MRKRHALRIGDEGHHAVLLVEGHGPEQHVVTELSAPVPLPNGVGGGARSSAGLLVHLAAAATAGALPYGWGPEVLRRAAVSAASDQVAKRLLAVDAMAVGDVAMVSLCGLTPAEQAWAHATAATEANDPGRVVAAVGALPPEAYRPKLLLLVRAAPAIRASATDVGPLDAQLRAFFDDEPLARVLHRAFGLSSGDPTTAADDARRLAGALALPDDLRGAILTGAAHAERPDGADERATGTAGPVVAAIGPDVRTLVSLRTGSRLLGPADVARLGTELADDLVDAGALAPATVAAAPVAPDAALYLRARVDPGGLTDDEVRAAGHVEEEARRTFPLPDPRTIEALGDTPQLRHFRALALLRLNRRSEMALDDLLPATRPQVEHLLATLDEAAGEAELEEVLSDEVLADPTAWPVLVALAGDGAVAPTAGLAARFPAFCEWLALNAAREHLFRGDWVAAQEAAQRCLTLATAENVRDEALNLKACALHYLGDDATAVRALEDAIDGAYSVALLANIGVVAARLQPELAAGYLGRLMREAPTTGMQVAAGMRAIGIWTTAAEGSWRSADGSELPLVIRDPLRELVTADMGIDDFRAFVTILAVKDGAWLAQPSALSGSPHAGSLEARIYQARARGLGDLVKALATEVGTPGTPQWVLDERRALRDATVEIALENIDEQTNAFGFLALTMQEAGLLDTTYDQVLFGAVGLGATAYDLTERNEELLDRLVTKLVDMRGVWSGMPEDDRTRLAPIIELATRRVAINRMRARDRDMSALIDTFNSVVNTANVTQRGTPMWSLVVTRMRPVQARAVAIRKELTPLRDIVEHDGVRDDIQLTINKTYELEGRCAQFT